MTVLESPSVGRLEFIGATGETIFVYDFRIFDDGDIRMFKDGGLLSLNIDYTVLGVNSPGGGTVTLMTPLSGGEEIIIESDVPLDQRVNFSVGGKLKPSTLESVIDKLTIDIQQVKSLLVNQGLTYPDGEFLDQLGGDTTLPILPANTPGNISVWTKNGAGKLVAGNLPEDPDSSTLRSELVSPTEVAPGAEIVGYFDPQDQTEKTVNDKLMQIQETTSGRNIIIGGDFAQNPWQRETNAVSVIAAHTAAGTSISYPGADRIGIFDEGGAPLGAEMDMVKTNNAPTVAQAGILSTHSCEFIVTSALGAVPADKRAGFLYVVEGIDWTRLAERNCVASFWVCTNKAGVYNIAFEGFNPDIAFFHPVTITTPNVQQYVTIPITPSLAQTLAGYSNGRGVIIHFILAAGANSFGTNFNTWVNGPEVNVSSSQVNFFDTIGNRFAIDLFQFEPGLIASPFEFEHNSFTLDKCQRYYEKSYDVAEAVPTFPGASGTENVSNFKGNQDHTIQFNTKKRPPNGNPATIHAYSPITGAIDNVYDVTGLADVAVNNYGLSQSNFAANVTATIGNKLAFSWAADFEIR